MLDADGVRCNLVLNVWLRGAAIRPVPTYAVVSSSVLEDIEFELANDSDASTEGLDDAFSRFENTQPHLAERISQALTPSLDETALALGYFLSIAIWMSFERTFNHRLRLVSGDDVRAADDAISFERELRYRSESLDVRAVMFIEQPAVIAFVHQHVDAALGSVHDDVVGSSLSEDVHAVVQSILVLTLALSHAVSPMGGAVRTIELLA